MGMVAALGRFDAHLFFRCLGIDPNDQPITHGRWLSYTGKLTEADARAAIKLVMTRAYELETMLQHHASLLEPNQAMVLLHWLCQKRLGKQINTPQTIHD
jgi:hypothetical protein